MRKRWRVVSTDLMQGKEGTRHLLARSPDAGMAAKMDKPRQHPCHLLVPGWCEREWKGLGHDGGCSCGEQEWRYHQREKRALGTAGPLLLLWFAWNRLCADPGLLQFQVLETEITETCIFHKFKSTMKIRFLGKLRWDYW